MYPYDHPITAKLRGSRTIGSTGGRPFRTGLSLGVGGIGPSLLRILTCTAPLLIRGTVSSLVHMSPLTCPLAFLVTRKAFRSDALDGGVRMMSGNEFTVSLSDSMSAARAARALLASQASCLRMLSSACPHSTNAIIARTALMPMDIAMFWLLEMPGGTARMVTVSDGPTVVVDIVCVDAFGGGEQTRIQETQGAAL